MLGLYNRVSFRPRLVRLNKQRPSCEEPATWKLNPKPILASGEGFSSRVQAMSVGIGLP